MKFTVEKDVIFKPVNIVRSIIKPKAMKMILQNMLIEIKDGMLILEGSDLDVGIRYRIPINDYESEGKITFPAENFVKIISESPEQKISINVDEEAEEAFIVSGSSKYKMRVLNADDYPVFPEMKEENSFVMSFENLKSMVFKTIIGVSDDKTRQVFNGVLFETKENRLNLVSSDSHMLAFSSVELGEEYGDLNMRIVVPTKILEEILKIDYAGNVKIYFNRQNIKFELDNITLVSRLIDQKYPKYEGVIPTINDKIAILPKDDLMNSFKRVFMFINKETKRISFYFSENELKIVARTELGVAEDLVKVEYANENMRIDFNYTYLKNIFSVFPKDFVLMKLNNSNSAVLLKTEDSDDDLWVVTPFVLFDE